MEEEEGLFEKFWRSLFGKKETGVDQTFVTEPLKRSEAFRQRYALWQNTNGLLQFIQYYRDSLERVLEQKQSNERVLIHESNGAAGIVLNFDQSEFTHPDFEFFFEWLKDRMLQLPYRLYTSDRHFKDKTDFVQRKERHYLKPVPVDPASLPVEQLYGNVMIEHIWVNEVPEMIKILATTYQGHNYQKPRSFEALCKHLFYPEV